MTFLTLDYVSFPLLLHQVYVWNAKSVEAIQSVRVLIQRIDQVYLLQYNSVMLILQKVPERKLFMDYK